VQLASAIVSGLSFATLLTLIVTPSLLMAPQAVRELVHELREKGRHFLIVPGEKRS